MKAGRQIEYLIDEVPVEGYTSVIEQSEDVSLVVTNTRQPIVPPTPSGFTEDEVVEDRCFRNPDTAGPRWPDDSRWSSSGDTSQEEPHVTHLMTRT